MIPSVNPIQNCMSQIKMDMFPADCTNTLEFIAVITKIGHIFNSYSYVDSVSIQPKPYGDS